MYCEKCGKVMHRIMRFSRKGNKEFYKCPKCGYESRELPLILKDCTNKTDKAFITNER